MYVIYCVAECVCVCVCVWVCVWVGEDVGDVVLLMRCESQFSRITVDRTQYTLTRNLHFPFLFYLFLHHSTAPKKRKKAHLDVV